MYKRQAARPAGGGGGGGATASSVCLAGRGGGGSRGLRCPRRPRSIVPGWLAGRSMAGCVARGCGHVACCIVYSTASCCVLWTPLAASGEHGAHCRRLALLLRPLPQMAPLHGTTFYRAMLCIRGTSHGPVSVSVSVCLCLSQAGVLLKRQNVGSHKQHHTIPQGL